MSGYTIIEKIIKNHTNSPENEIFPGNIVWVDLDLVTARDYAGPQVIKLFEQHFTGTVFNHKKILLTPDCYPYGNDPHHASDQEILRTFSKNNDVTITDLGSGIGSHLVFKRGYASPGDIVIGADSHYNLLGALGILGFGAGDVMLAFAFKTGKTWLKIPETVKVTFTGLYEYPTTVKDLALFTLRELHSWGITGKAVEFYGELISNLDIEERITLCSLITEASGFISLIPPDEKIKKYYQKYNNQDIDLFTADLNAKYQDQLTLDIQDLGIYIACPPHPHNVKPIYEVLGTPINFIVIGSCTNGTANDIRQAAQLLRDKKIDENIQLGIVPATREDVLEIAKDGTYIQLLEAGANFFGAGCSTCAKGQYGLTGGENAVTLTTGNRNTQGKIGPAPIYLASPLVAAASAIEGKISLPK